VQEALYQNEVNPTCYWLGESTESDSVATYNLEGISKQGDKTCFNDRELIKQCCAVHIDSITIFADQYITGIEIALWLDNGRKTVTRKIGAGANKKQLKLDPLEHIWDFEATFGNGYIHSMTLKTSKGNTLSL
jgi:hypothetical protein